MKIFNNIKIRLKIIIKIIQMLNCFWNYASPIKNSIAQNKSTNTLNKNCYYSNEILKGAFYVITNNSNAQKISSDCLIELNHFNNDYYLFKIKYDGNEFIIERDTKLFQFNDSLGNKCVTWQKNSNYYVLELYPENVSKNKENIFLQNIPSINPNSIIQSETRTYTKSKSNDINLFSDYSNKENNFLNSNISYMKPANKIISKKSFMEKFEVYKEIYFIKGVSFIYDKLSEEVIPFEDSKSGNVQSFLKVNYIGNNAYILVLEQNDMIISFIKIVDENDISINENSYSLSFNYMNETGDIIPYIFKFEEKSLNEINYFKNLIMRCIYEKNNNYCDNLSEFDFKLNLADFNSIENNSAFDSESKFDNSWLLSTIKKHYNENIFFNGNINSSAKSSKSLENYKYYNDENSSMNGCNIKNININNYGKIGLIFEEQNIKLFNEKGEIIKTYAIKIKNQIKNVDVSSDNHYILITCDKNIVIINTDINDKSPPILLSINPSDISQYNIINQSFAKSKFVNDENSGDKIIISNLGMYTIMWKFKEVLKGDMNNYRIINNYN